MTRQATHAEIRAHWSHGEGSRKVRIGRDGSVTYYGSRSDTDRSHDYWHEAGSVEQYGVEDNGTIHAQRRGAGRPLKGAQPRERYQVMLEQRLRDKAKDIGGGNFSAGVALALESYPNNQQMRSNRDGD